LAGETIKLQTATVDTGVRPSIGRRKAFSLAIVNWKIRKKHSDHNPAHRAEFRILADASESLIFKGVPVNSLVF